MDILNKKNDIEKTKNIITKEELKIKIDSQNKDITEFNNIKDDLSKKLI